ncbi:uncharacterized protein TNCV_4164281 [Trichonephila clavipes]|nr:uncharacterized protein TNCV_4164281 [Trichonephila clavipes]
MGRPLTTQVSSPQNWGGNEPNRTVTCMVLKATANDRRHLALCHDEFRGPRSGLCRSAFQTTGTAVRKVGGGFPMTTTSRDDRYIIPAGEKRPTAVNKRHCSATLQQRGDKCRGLPWPDAFTKGAYSPAVNAASR